MAATGGGCEIGRRLQLRWQWRPAAIASECGNGPGGNGSFARALVAATAVATAEALHCRLGLQGKHPHRHAGPRKTSLHRPAAHRIPIGTVDKMLELIGIVAGDDFVEAGRLNPVKAVGRGLGGSGSNCRSNSSSNNIRSTTNIHRRQRGKHQQQQLLL